MIVVVFPPGRMIVVVFVPRSGTLVAIGAVPSFEGRSVPSGPGPVWWHRAGASCCLGWWPPPPLQRSQGSGRRRGSLVVLPRREDRAPRKGHRRAPVLRPLPGRSRQCGAGLLSGGRLLLLLSALDTHAATSLAPATPSRA